MKKIVEIYREINKKEWFEPIFVMGVSLTVTFGIVVGAQNMFGEKVVSITTNEAEGYYYEGNLDAAIKEYTKLDKGNKWPIWKVRLAEVYSLKGEIDKSNSLLKEAILTRNKIKEANVNEYTGEDNELISEVVFVYFMNKEYDQALSLAEDFILNGGEYKPLTRTLFSIYMAVGEKENAIELIESYNVNEESAYDISILSNMQMVAGDIENGIETLKTAFNLDKNEIKVLDVVESVSEYKRQEMVETLEVMIENNPNEDAYKLFLAQIKVNNIKDDIIEAQDILADLSLRIADTKTYMAVNAHYLDYVGRAEDAKIIIDKIAEEKSDSTYHIAGRYYYIKGDLKKAEEYCKKSILENREYPNSYILMAEISSTKGENINVEGYLRTAIQKEPFDTSLITNIGDYYTYKLAQVDKGMAYYDLALRCQPDSDELYRELAQVEILRENYEASIEYLEEAIGLNESNGDYYRTLGTLYLKVGENEKFLENSRQAYSLNEEDILALNNLGYYYMIIEGDVWRGFSNIEAAFEEMPINIDSELKGKITDNYLKAKKVFEKIENEESQENSIELTDFELFY